MIPGLARCLLNPANLPPISIAEETEDKAAETGIELYAEEYYVLLYNLNTSDDGANKETSNKQNHPFFPLR
jgi:hypothetical protein